MKLTIEDHRETIKGYGHVKPAPMWGAVRCATRCPGAVSRICTLAVDHSGPHVAHGRFKKVVAVWDGGAVVPSRSRDEGPVSVFEALRGRLLGIMPSMEEGLLLILFLGMVGFVVDWTLRLLGLR